MLSTTSINIFYIANYFSRCLELRELLRPVTIKEKCAISQKEDELLFLSVLVIVRVVSGT